MARSNLKWLGQTAVDAAATQPRPAPELRPQPRLDPPVPRGCDYVELAVRLGRAQFMDACPYFFLVGRCETRSQFPDDPTGSISPRAVAAAGAAQFERRPPTLVLPVRKVQQTFESMITLGRTENNDIVVRDAAVSKFHAFFRIRAGQIELTDAGSRNGTQVGPRRLDPKGEAVPARAGDTIRLGPLEFSLLDAGACWDRLRFHPDW